jgi:hypothetical protein
MADLDPRALKIQELLMDEFINILENGVETLTKDGDKVNLRPGAQSLSVIRQFLKDNNVQAVLNSDDPLVKSLTDNLPEFEDDDPAHYDA